MPVKLEPLPEQLLTMNLRANPLLWKHHRHSTQRPQLDRRTVPRDLLPFLCRFLVPRFFFVPFFFAAFPILNDVGMGFSFGTLSFLLPFSFSVLALSVFLVANLRVLFQQG